MKKFSILLIILTLFFSSCKKEIDPFLVSKQNIGLLNDSTQVKDLRAAFINDSIVKYVTGDEFTGNINDITIYDKTGNQLLILTPSQSLDSTSTVKNIRIVDNRYKTSKGVTANSTFKAIKNNYKISSIQNTLRSIIISVNDINAYFIIDKKELPASMRFDMDLKIEAIQIPDEAKIKDFYLYWTNTP
jgi:hypothetical protein